MKDQKASELITAAIIKLLGMPENLGSGVHRPTLLKDLANQLKHVEELEKGNEPLKTSGVVKFEVGPLDPEIMEKLFDIKPLKKEEAPDAIRTADRYGLAGVPMKWGAGSISMPRLSIEDKKRLQKLIMAPLPEFYPTPECSNHAQKKAAASQPAEPTKAKKEPTIKVRVTHGSNEHRWYNELKGQTILVNHIAQGCAYKLDCGPKFQHDYGTIPAGHFELVTDGIEHFEIQIPIFTFNKYSRLGLDIFKVYKAVPSTGKNLPDQLILVNEYGFEKPVIVHTGEINIKKAFYKPVVDEVGFIDRMLAPDEVKKVYTEGLGAIDGMKKINKRTGADVLNDFAKATAGIDRGPFVRVITLGFEDTAKDKIALSHIEAVLKLHGSIEY
jgi:hypothetical protein